MALLRLPAPGLRGTFAKAYHLLTLLTSKIGWDELLKTRSQVFVMEEEYRLHKTHASVDLNGLNDASSVAGMKSPPLDREPSRTPSDIPIIRISTESARTPNAIDADQNGGKFPDAPQHHDDDDQGSEEHTQDEQEKEEAEVEQPVLEKPQTAHEKEDPAGASAAGQLSGEGDEAVSAFSNKRLCERWLGESFLRVPSSGTAMGSR